MIDTVIFDLGSVLVDFHPESGMESIGFPREVVDVFMDKIYGGLWEECDRKNIDEAQIRKLFKENVPGYEVWVDKLWDNIGCVTAVRPYAYDWVKSIKQQGIKLYVLSNFGRAAFEINSKMYDFLELMDGQVISYEVEELKPEPAIYNELIAKYDIDPATAVFIDDRQANIETGKWLGMEGIVFKSYEQASKELEQLLGKPSYDYLVVGAGLFGATFAEQAHAAGKKVLVIDRRDHIAGNAYTENINGINVHKYGAHIFHTNSDEVWGYLRQFVDFNSFVNSPIANYKGEIYSLPFNMYTFNRLWGVVTPEEAKKKLEAEMAAFQNRGESGEFSSEQSDESRTLSEPRNLEEQAISLVGRELYEKLVRGYTEKQWGCKCEELPAFIIKRLPVRFNYDNNYFNAKHQGIPIGGYTQMVEALLEGIEVRLGVDYLQHRDELNALADKIIYTGAIDEFYEYKLGALKYRSLRFDTKIIESDNYQGNAVVNYTDAETPWTRIIEHKWFEFGKDYNGQPIEGTVVTTEYPAAWEQGSEPYYPVNDEANNDLYDSYRELASMEKNVIFGGRLGAYKYYDMDKVIEAALSLARSELS